jgi:hypothetical protein
VVSFAVTPALPKFLSVSNGAHSRKCAGSVSPLPNFFRRMDAAP